MMHALKLYHYNNGNCDYAVETEMGAERKDVTVSSRMVSASANTFASTLQDAVEEVRKISRFFHQQYGWWCHLTSHNSLCSCYTHLSDLFSVTFLSTIHPSLFCSPSPQNSLVLHAPFPTIIESRSTINAG